MWNGDEPLGPMAILGPPALIVATICLLYFLPGEVLTFLTAWTLASFPIGILIGHCVLSEE